MPKLRFQLGQSASRLLLLTRRVEDTLALLDTHASPHGLLPFGPSLFLLLVGDSEIEDPAVCLHNRPKSTTSSCVTTGKSFTSLSSSFFVSEMSKEDTKGKWLCETGRCSQCWVSTDHPIVRALETGERSRLSPNHTPPLAQDPSTFHLVLPDGFS